MTKLDFLLYPSFIRGFLLSSLVRDQVWWKHQTTALFVSLLKTASGGSRSSSSPEHDTESLFLRLKVSLICGATLLDTLRFWFSSPDCFTGRIQSKLQLQRMSDPEDLLPGHHVGSVLRTGGSVRFWCECDCDSNQQAEMSRGGGVMDKDAEINLLTRSLMSL